MKKIKFTILQIIAIVSCIYLFSNYENKKYEVNMTQSTILDENFQPKPALLELLKFFQIKHDGSLKNIVDETQKQWLRKSGKERWEIDEVKIGDENKLMDIFRQLGCVDEVTLTKSDEKIPYVCILGALATTTVCRTATAFNLWNQGIKFENLVFLVGQRERNVVLEDLEAFNLEKNNKKLKVRTDWNFSGVLPKNETEIARIIFDQIDWPQNFLENVKVTFVDTPMQKNPDGTLRRPNTPDTIYEWLKTNPAPGKCVFISNNPYVGYQNAVVKTYLPKNFSFLTIGEAASRNERISIYLDTIARWLYVEHHLTSSKKQ